MSMSSQTAESAHGRFSRRPAVTVAATTPRRVDTGDLRGRVNPPRLDPQRGGTTLSTDPPPDATAVRERQRADWDRSAPGWRHRAELGAGDTTLTDRLIATAQIRPGQRVL